MKPTAALMALLGLAATGAALAYQTVTRERDYRLQLRRGDAARVDGQTFMAIEAYSGAIVLRPDSTLAHLRRGETYQQRGDLDAAARDFRTAVTLDPAATRPLEELGDVLYQRQRFSAAADAYAQRLRLDDRSPALSYKLALARYRDGNIGSALAILTDTIRLNDGSAEAYYLRGLCLRDQRRPAEAIQAFERAVALSPGMVPAREELAELYAANGARTDELEQLQLLASLDRQHVERLLTLALAQARSGHTELAVVTLGSALERTSDQPRVYGALGQVWLEMTSTRTDALNKALEALGRAVSTPAASSEVLTLYGRALERNNNFEAAERVLAEAVGRFPLDPSSLLEYANVAERQDHPDPARTALLQYGMLVSADADPAGRALRIGVLSLQVGDRPTASSWIHRAASMISSDNRHLAALADAQLQLGEMAAAKATIQRGLDKDPTDATFLALSRRAN